MKITATSNVMIVTLCALLPAVLVGVTPNVAAQDVAPHNDAITAARLRADLMFLAGDGFRGRLTNTPENALALEWVKARFEWLGLTTMGAGSSYFAPFAIMTSTLEATNELIIDWGTGTSHHSVGSDFHPRFFSASARASGPVVFVGFGISAPALKHDDLTGKLRGKVLLVLDNEPGAKDANSPFDGLVNSEHGSQLRKTLAAQARGAAAVLFVADVHNQQRAEDFDGVTKAYWPSTPMRVPRYSLASWMQQVHIPAGQISVALAEQLVKGSGKSLVTFARASETSNPPVPLPGVSLTITTNLRRTSAPDRNVVAALKGNDDALKEEFVIMAAHVDHNGADGTQIFSGADDNASGTVGLLAIADAYAHAAAAGVRPKRSILFLVTNTEERGLLGAWGYVEAPVVPLARTVAMLNIDMIGRNEEVPVGGDTRFRGFDVQSAESNRNALNLFGWSRSSTLTAAIDSANDRAALTLHKRYDNNISQVLRRTDIWPFLQNGIPAVTFTTGLHPDYHRVGDRPERIDFGKAERIARLVHQVSWDLANAPGRPTITTP